MAIRGEFDSKRRVQRRQRAILVRAFIGLFIFSGILAGLYSIPRFPQINISQVNISGNESVSTSRLEAEVQKVLAGNNFFFFPKKNIFLYSKDQLRGDLLRLDPRLSSVNVSFINFQTIGIEVSERKPHSLWCGQDLLPTVASSTSLGCYFLDETGFIFAEAPIFSGTLFVEYYGANEPPYIGNQFVSEAEYKSFVYLIELLTEYNLPVSKVVVKNNELDILLKQGGKLIFSRTDDLEKQFNNFKSLVESNDFKGKKTSGHWNFQYIDLRFGSKVFFKL